MQEGVGAGDRVGATHSAVGHELGCLPLFHEPRFGEALVELAEQGQGQRRIRVAKGALDASEQRELVVQWMGCHGLARRARSWRRAATRLGCRGWG